jgi:hypothetical protein
MLACEMGRSLGVRAATLVLALLLPLLGMRAQPSACCVDDCGAPCCARDTTQSTVVPLLPCCRTVSIDRASSQPTPSTVDHEPAPVAAPAATARRAVAGVVPSSPPLLAVRRAAARPLYRRHCALLL